MAPSISSLLSLSHVHRFHFPSPHRNPNPTLLPTRTQFLSFASNSSPKHSSTPPPPEPSEKKSFAVATGEIFLGLASRLIKSRGPVADSASVAMFENSSLKGEMYEDRIGALVEDEIQPDVVWEQRLKDIEAERNRRVVTSPGFSFSAAGLLFPYHLGVAQFLIQNGYIKETTPLAGSSAGAIVCAVIASGASMEEALVATKILAEDCRNRGTAFRLGGHIPIPKWFFRRWGNVLDDIVMLKDPVGNLFPVYICIRHERWYFCLLVEKLRATYGMESTFTVAFSLRNTGTFKIKVYGPYCLEIDYPIIDI